MRYPDGGGLTGEQRKRREEVRMRAVDLFDTGPKTPKSGNHQVQDGRWALSMSRLSQAQAAISTRLRT